MSSRTSAMPDDFPHYLSWFGKVPDFEFLASYPDFHCRDEYFRLRILWDSRYQAHKLYADAEGFTMETAVQGVEDLNQCRQIKRMEMKDRPAAYRAWFLKRKQSKLNDVWEYRTPTLAEYKLREKDD